MPLHNKIVPLGYAAQSSDVLENWAHLKWPCHRSQKRSSATVTIGSRIRLAIQSGWVIIPASGPRPSAKREDSNKLRKMLFEIMIPPWPPLPCSLTHAQQRRRRRLDHHAGEQRREGCNMVHLVASAAARPLSCSPRRRQAVAGPVSSAIAPLPPAPPRRAARARRASRAQR